MFNTASALAEARAVSDPALKVGGIIGVMAVVMIEAASGAGSCSEADLAEAGFTSAEIIEFAADAKALAASRAVRMVERPSVDGPVETVNAIKDLIAAADRHGVGLDREGRRIVERATLALGNLRLVFDIAA